MLDRKELCKRWTLGYIEPSLFYLPFKTNDGVDDFSSYLNITISSLGGYSNSISGVFLRYTTRDVLDLWNTVFDPYQRFESNTKFILDDRIVGESSNMLEGKIYVNNFSKDTSYKYITVTYDPYYYPGWSNFERYEYAKKYNQCIGVALYKHQKVEWSKTYKNPATYMDYSDWYYKSSLPQWAWDIKNKQLIEYS